MADRLMRMLKLIIVTGVMLALMPTSFAKNAKGILDDEEHAFINNELVPILIQHGICTKASGDCRDDFIICMSVEALSCDVYGVSDARAIRRLLLAVLASRLAISHFSVWRSRYHHTELMERPLVSYVDRTGLVARSR